MSESRLMIVRFAHMYQAHESKLYSKTVTVDLSSLFPGKHITKVTEMSLSANQELATTNYGRGGFLGAQPQAGDYDVSVGPMEIKTYIITHTDAAQARSPFKRLMNSFTEFF